MQNIVPKVWYASWLGVTSHPLPAGGASTNILRYRGRNRGGRPFVTVIAAKIGAMLDSFSTISDNPPPAGGGVFLTADVPVVAVAQLVESWIVIPVVVGSSPISHPTRFFLR